MAVFLVNQVLNEYSANALVINSRREGSPIAMAIWVLVYPSSINFADDALVICAHPITKMPGAEFHQRRNQTSGNFLAFSQAIAVFRWTAQVPLFLPSGEKNKSFSARPLKRLDWDVYEFKALCTVFVNSSGIVSPDGVRSVHNSFVS